MSKVLFAGTANAFISLLIDSYKDIIIRELINLGYTLRIGSFEKGLLFLAFEGIHLQQKEHLDILDEHLFTIITNNKLAIHSYVLTTCEYTKFMGSNVNWNYTKAMNTAVIDNVINNNQEDNAKENTRPVANNNKEQIGFKT